MANNIKTIVLYIGQSSIEEQGPNPSGRFWDAFHKALDDRENVTIVCAGNDGEAIGDVTFGFCDTDGACDILITNRKDGHWNKGGTENHYAWPSHKDFHDKMKHYAETLIAYCQNGFN